MSRYYITTTNGAEVKDEEGVELPDHDALRAILRRTLTAILHDEAKGTGRTKITAQAHDEQGRLVMNAQASFSVADQ